MPGGVAGEQAEMPASYADFRSVKILPDQLQDRYHSVRHCNNRPQNDD